jgi:hypothetical protein
VNSCIVGCAVGLPHALRTASRAHRSFLWLIVFFSLSYLALLIPGALTDIACDRYMAPLVPLLFLAILMPLPRQKHSAPLVAWICLFIMSGYAVAATHDHFEQLRAGLRAAHSLEKAGIGRNRISPGGEHDGWTQLLFTDRIRGVDYTDQFADDTSKGFWFEAWDHTPNLSPDYVVLNRNRPDAPQAGVLSVEFDAWLPPHRRSVVLWKRSDLTAELVAARVLSELHAWR